MSFTGDNSGSFDDDGYFGYDPRLSSQRFDSFNNFGDSDSVADDGVFITESMTDPPLPVYGSGGGMGLDFEPDLDGVKGGGGFGVSVLPPHEEMQAEQGFALREWRRLNAIRLAEKDRLEKEMRSQIIAEADEYKVDFYKRRLVTVEKKKVSNREKQKIFLENQEKFHKEAAANYWKAIAELVPNEVPTIEKRGKKDKDKKPSITVIQGPKPGKPTDLSRMRQILLKLKHNTPLHLKTAPPATAADAKTNTSSPAAQASSSQPVAAA
uniref:Clathrin light chain n=1 Tax=Kalanchoe fedtschenkoi TaxID=63787 RepID=A0A7N0TQK5_KALFE